MKMPASYIHKASENDCRNLGPRLRNADVNEIKAGSGHNDMAEALLISMKLSSHVWAVEHPEYGYVHTMVGVGALDDHGQEYIGWGSPWLLAAPYDTSMQKLLLHLTPLLLAHMLRIYPALMNMVDIRHQAAISWLRRVGFTILPARPWGVEQRMFHQLVMHREDKNYV